MSARNETGGAAATAPALPKADDFAPAAMGYPTSSRRRKLVVHAIGPHGRFTVTGQDARTLLALVQAGPRGVTALEVGSWAFRLAAYVHRLRAGHWLGIETVREAHPGGTHARYILRSPVELVP
jgi:hypothetical protein